MKKMIFVNLVSLIIITLILIQPVSSNISCSQNEIIIVDNEGDGDYQTIQQAIDNANSGDIIQIYSGIYNEKLIIQKERITLKGIDHELGAGTDTEYPIINGDQIGNVIEIYGKHCQITSCIIQNSGHGIFDAGIFILSNEVIISTNGIVSNQYGILVNNCTENIIENNYILSNTMDGIYLLFTEENIISNNIIRENGFQGMFMYEANKNTITENTFSLNGKDGIHLRNTCMNNEITKNIIHSNSIDGIKIMDSNVYYNNLNNNEIYSNGWNGVHIVNGQSNIISDNMIYLNLLNGIQIGNADNNRIIRNTIQDNKEEGIVFLFSGSQNNQIYYNNIINDNAFDGGKNIWDDGRDAGGNYWSYYKGLDVDGDGIGDTPYIIEGMGNMDNTPFIDPLYPPQTPSQPRGPTIGVPGTSYTYRTTSSDNLHNKIQYGWDWNGDDVVDEWTFFYSPEEPCETSYIWNQNGTYQIKVKAMDDQGFQSDWSQPLSITMPKDPKNKIDIIGNFIFNFCQQILYRIYAIIVADQQPNIAKY
ncbi:hypothetical protein B6U98_01150 [Thermoplasmatales archaeon ex4572_165]|nr:MAG: hypothetical protein B6U98_01150 [Thermoplasmatales archaeon ex4572_165]